MPAPTESAMAASVATAQVKRARFAFTIDSFESAAIHRHRQPGGLGEIPGFASPPRDGFALDGVGPDGGAPLTRNRSRPDGAGSMTLRSPPT